MLALTTPQSLSTFVLQTASKLSSNVPMYVDYEPIEGAEEQRCFPNVDAAVERHGGERLIGWMLWEMPGAFIEAIHHAVWKKPSGEIVDITPKIDGELRIVFVIDPAATYEGKFIDPRRFPAFGNRLARDFIRVRGEQEALVEPFRKVGRYVVPYDIAERAHRKLDRSNRLFNRLKAGEKK
ncbi:MULTISPECIES: hypothetical protein [unclassified Sphingomonas]|jgi:hypothetical protein|uniref:hypothetical protein n=1 Tax=unclassified Sphingomonas TaxID=196159 RepID=UPI00226AA05F|nr:MULTISPECIES: hypothetical protein [unclassified Sphingomonas]